MQKYSIERSFTSIGTLVVATVVGLLVILSGVVYNDYQTVLPSTIEHASLTPCNVVHMYSALGSHIALSVDNLKEIQEGCVVDGEHALPLRHWTTPVRFAHGPSVEMALALNEKKFTAQEWSRTVYSDYYPLASSTEAPASQMFSFWEYDAWYWETNTKTRQGDQALLLNTIHEQVLAEKKRLISGEAFRPMPTPGPHMFAP